MMSVVEFFSQPLWHRLSLTLAHFLWQGLAVAVVVGAAIQLLRPKRGNPRYAAYLLAFLVMAACPPATFTLLGAPAEPPLSGGHLAAEIESPGPVPSSASPAPLRAISESNPTVSPVRHMSWRERLDTTVQSILPWTPICWMAGVSILSVRLLLGFIGVSRWRRGLEPLTEELQTRVALLSQRLNMPGFSRIFTSQHAQEAVAVSYLRPMVLLPAALVVRMSPEMLEAVIAHELAHIRRLDLWVNLAQRVVETLLFYHPAVWWLSNRLRTEREFCCDELAVRATGERLMYASALEHAGRVRLGVRQPTLAVGLGQGRKPTLNRVRHILGLPSTPPDSHFWLAGVGGLLVLGVLMMHVPSSRAERAEPSNQTDKPPIDSSRDNTSLPPGWSLDYDNGLCAGGATTWISEMARDLASLEFSPAGLGLSDTSWRDERYDFEIHSAAGGNLGTVHIRFDRPEMQTGRMTLKPGRYTMEYTREFGKNGDNIRMHSGPFVVDLPEPGMYKLRFPPRLGTAEIRGTLGDCYALNFEKTGDGFNLTGFLYLDPRLSKPYAINGLPAGTYRLSAVTQDDHSNNLVSQAQATVKANEKLTVDIAPPPRGDCSLHGVIAGRRGAYWTPTSVPQQTSPQWFVLIRTRGSGPVEQVGAYEAQTMDSRYVIRGRNIVQETEDRASYSIAGIAPGEYTVTVIEHPWCQGLPIERQQSQPLTLRPGETATLDFDLRDPPVRPEDRDRVRPLGRNMALPPLERIGHADRLARTKDKRLLICFFDINQRASRNNLLELNRRFDSLAARNILVLAVQASDVQAEILDKWLKDNSIAFPVGSIAAPADRIRFEWGVKGLPWLILTDSRHVVTAEGVALADLETEVGEMGEHK